MTLSHTGLLKATGTQRRCQMVGCARAVSWLALQVDQLPEGLSEEMVHIFQRPTLLLQVTCYH